MKLNYYRAAFNPEFLYYYFKFKPYTMTSIARMYALYKATKYIIKNKIPGDFVECGVYKGGSCMMMGALLSKYDSNGKRSIWLYDTFAGMTEPTREDIKFNGAYAPAIYETKIKDGYVDWAYSPLESVKQAVKKTKFKNYIFIVGDVRKSIPNNMPNAIALLRLDTDFYESTKHELNHLYPLLIEKGVLIADDYNSWKGATKAVDEYFAKFYIDNMHPIQSTGLIGVK